MSNSIWLQFRDEVKSSSSCIDYLHSRGFNVSRPGQLINCPSFIRLDNNPSFAVYDDHCYDFSTNSPYDIIDLCALDQFNGDKTKALEYLAGRKLPRYSQHFSPVIEAQAKAFSDRVAFWESSIDNNPIISPFADQNIQLHILDYLNQRGFSHEAVKLLHLGYSSTMGKLMIPFFNRHKQLVYAAGRDLTGVSARTTHHPKYWYMSLTDDDFSEILDKCIFGIDSVKPGFVQPDTTYDPELGQVVKLSTHHIKYDFLAVCEGMLDVLSFRAEGWAAITGKISAKQEREFLDICRQYRDKGQKIFICFDSDKAGKNFQRKMALLLFRNGIPFVAGHLPTTLTVTRKEHPKFGQEIHIKDVNDYYAAGGSLDDLVKNAKDGMMEIANDCSDEDELAQRFKEAGRSCDRWQIDKLKRFALSVVSETVEEVQDEQGNIVREKVKKLRFNPKAVGFLYAEAMRPLQDCDIAKFVEDKHKLVYDTLGQFYEYRKGVWKAMNDLLIQQKIIRVMNGHISAQKVSGVCKFLKMDLADNVQFNTKNNFVFQNGTLWLDEETSDTYDDPDNPFCGMPKNFKQSRPEDMSTIQVSYNFDPKAHNSVLERAAQEWTREPDGTPNEAKYRLLKQMFGYILFVKNTLQKFFILKGDGANGKSTCMHCIEAILGKENTTSLQISRLSSEFDPVVLKNSRVNLCYDAQSSIENAQEVLKAIVGGDQITAAHKGVDAESFTTNAKFIVSANKFFSANDVSRGLLRRMLFIAFNNTFTPKAGESSIEDEIMKDLPGLFNFAYEGYKDLKKSGYFCETDEQAALLEEFREQLSPVILFAREELYAIEDTVLPAKIVYDLYSQWCKSNGEKALGRTKFIPEIRQVIRTDGNVIPDPYRDNETKEWMFTFPVRAQSNQDDSEGVHSQSDRQEVQEVSTQDEKVSHQSAQESATIHSAPVSAEQNGKEEQASAAQTEQALEDSKALQEEQSIAAKIRAQLPVSSQNVQTNTRYHSASYQQGAFIRAKSFSGNWQDFVRANLAANRLRNVENLMLFLEAHPEKESELTHKTSNSQQAHIDGVRIHIPDPKAENFPYDERMAWNLFDWLKRFGRNWMSKLSGVFTDYQGMLGDEDKAVDSRISENALKNLGVYLTKNPSLKFFLPGIEDILDFGY